MYKSPPHADPPRPTWPQAYFWLLCGALVGFGMIGILSIGMPFLLLGVALLFYGIARVGPGGIWAALIGFGGIPSLFLLIPYLTQRRCPPGDVLLLPPEAQQPISCGYVPQSYLSLGLSFAGVALAGAVWGFMERRIRRGVDH